MGYVRHARLAPLQKQTASLAPSLRDWLPGFTKKNDCLADVPGCLSGGY
jgi:hypothetical protein